MFLFMSPYSGCGGVLVSIRISIRMTKIASYYIYFYESDNEINRGRVSFINRILHLDIFLLLISRMFSLRINVRFKTRNVTMGKGKTLQFFLIIFTPFRCGCPHRCSSCRRVRPAGTSKSAGRTELPASTATIYPVTFCRGPASLARS